MHCQCGNDKWIWKTKLMLHEDTDQIVKYRVKVCSKCKNNFPKEFDEYPIF